MKEEWLFSNAVVPVDVETTAALVAEIKRLIDVVGGMALAQQEPVDGTQVSKVWWDGEKLMAKPIPLEDIYQPVDWKAEYLKSVESGCITLDELREANAELAATNRQVEILSDALAESRREVASLKANAALDKKAENARELGLDYEPHKGLSEHLAQATNGRVRIDPVTGDVGIGTPPAQPAPVQATMKLESSGPGYGPAPKQKLSVRHVSLIDEGKTPPVQPAVPDAIGPNEDELPAYAAGWNDCRAEMLKGMK
jgi:hypothetical protein